MKNKEYYEELIRTSPLFFLERETSAYKKEAYKMVELLYEYMLSINESKYIEYGLEITETANKCISSFKKENGDFLNYFNVAMSKEYRRASAKRQIDEMRGGIHMPSEDEKNIRKIIKYLNSHGIEMPTEEQIMMIANAYGMKAQSIKELLIANNSAVVISPEAVNDDGEATSIFDMLSTSEALDKNLIEREACENLLATLEKSYVDCQERQKSIISASLTRLICEIIVFYEIDFSKYSFIDNQIIREYIKNGHIPSQKDLALLFHKKESSVSRTVRIFLSTLKEKLINNII